MKLTGYETITRDQLLQSKSVLEKVIYHGTKTQVELKDGTYTVGSLLRLQGKEAMQWGA